MYNYIYNNKYLTTEQRILWDAVYANFNPTAIVPMAYTGPLSGAGTEFTVEDANKLYLGLSIDVCNDTQEAMAVDGVVFFRNGVSIMYYWNSSPFIVPDPDTTFYMMNTIHISNIAFSRLMITSNITGGKIRFIGYKFTK